MEARTLSPRMPVSAWRPVVLARTYIGRWGLIIALAALPVYYAIRDLTHGYAAGRVHNHLVIAHDLTNFGSNVVLGLANGAI